MNDLGTAGPELERRLLNSVSVQDGLAPVEQIIRRISLQRRFASRKKERMRQVVLHNLPHLLGADTSCAHQTS